MKTGIFDYLFDKIMHGAFNHKFEESMKPALGEVRIEKYSDDKLVELRDWDNNLIVTNSFKILTSLMETADANKKVDTFALGNQGVLNEQLVFPVINDQTLRNELFRKQGPVSVVVDDIDKFIQFNFNVTESEGNGAGAQVYSESGLFSADGTMFSRKVFSELVKTAEQSLNIYWKIKWE